MFHESRRNLSQVVHHSPMQRFFLRRLEHLIDYRARYAELLEPGHWHNKLIARAIYSTYKDLVDLKLPEEARAILERGRTLNP